MDDELLRIVETIESWQTHREAMRQRCVAWLRSPSFRTAFYDDAHPPFVLKVLLEKEYGKAKAAEPWKKLQQLGEQSPELWRQYEQLAAEGQVVFAHAVIVNPQFKVETNTSLPCLVLVSEDQGAGGVACGGLLASAAGELYALGAGAEDHPQTHALVLDDEFQLFRRRPLPEAESQDFKAVFLDVQLRASWIPPVAVPFLPLLMAPSGGAVVQIPWHIATGTPPPLSGAMAAGQWAEVAELDRQADRAVANNAGVRSVFSWLGTCVKAVVVASIAFGVCLVIFNRDSRGPRHSTPSARSSASSKPREAQKPVTWSQPAAVRKSMSIVSAADYEPLIGEGAAGSGFIFRIDPGIFLAATSRHQFGDPDKAPATLFDLDDLTVTLDVEQVLRLPESQIQVVSAVSQPATSLEFQSSDVIAQGDELWLVLEKGRHIAGKLTTRGRHPLTSRSRLLRMAVNTSENVSGSSGAPIVQAKTGRVVGVMQSADKAQNPTFLEFETLKLIPNQ